MGRYRKKPIVVEALQFTGANWDEMRDFTGQREVGDTPGHMIENFNSIGTFLLPDPEQPDHVAELWVAANSQWLPIQEGEWVIKDSLGFYPCQDRKFQETYDPEEG